jgi:hypothetical protein
MAGPGQRAITQVLIATGEAQVQYAPTNLAYQIQNFEATPEGTLRAVRGACLYEPVRGGDQYGGFRLPTGYSVFNALPGGEQVTIYGVFHAGLLEGRAPTLVVRADDKLYLHAGQRRAWRVIYEGLTQDGRAGTPDMFAVVNGTIIWTNGVDPALVISHNGMVVPLGFDKAPGAISAEGPQQTPDTATDYRNSGGYSWPGRLGTIGDFADTNDGAVLAGGWLYARAWEDVHGNISPLSRAGVEVTITLQRANASISDTKVDISTKVDDLPRQMLVKVSGSGPEHAIASRLYRSPDNKRFPAKMHLVERILGTAGFVYPDNVPDSRLGAPAKEYLPVPQFTAMTSHAGSLVILVGARLLRSEKGFAGTFPEEYAMTPDSGGAVLTAAVSHGGRLIAFTEKSMMDVTDPLAPPKTMLRGIGCVAPRSLQGLPDGTLIWLSRDAFYGWHPDKGVMKLSDPIHRLVKTELATGSLRNAVSVIEPESREYRCAVARAGSFDNDLLLCFGGQGWSEIDLGFKIADMCVTDDPRYLVLFAGGRVTTSSPFAGFNEGGAPVATATTVAFNIYAMGRETLAQASPERTYVYRAAWLRGDDTGLQPLNVHTLYIGLVDELNESFDINIFANGSSAPTVDSPQTMRAVGVQVEDLIGDLTLGTGKVHARRLFWRRVTVALENVNTWSFELRSTTPFHVAAFAFHTSFATGGDPLARIPFGEDE